MALNGVKKFKHFDMWCQKVLPLVYDDSLSYMETLCKVVDYLNKMMDALQEVPAEFEELQKEIAEIQGLIEKFDTEYIEELISKRIATMIFVELSASGYVVYHIPESWGDISFATTGLDINVPSMQEYGHLVLIY